MWRGLYLRTQNYAASFILATVLHQLHVMALRCIIFLYYHHSYHYFIYYYKVCRSRWPRALRRGSVAARLLGLGVRKPQGAGISVSSEWCLISSRCLRIGLIGREEESYRMWCVWKWSQNLNNEEAETYWAVEPWKIIMFTCRFNVYDIRLRSSLFRTQQLLQYHNV